jgi:hypothetical protein
MKTFWDLPKPVHERIYRLHLVAEEQPVSFEAYRETCGYPESDGCETARPAKLLCPSLLDVYRKMEREASPIYFGENTFQLFRRESLSLWKYFTAPWHVKQIRRLALSCWTELRMLQPTELLRHSTRCRSLNLLRFASKKKRR